MPLRVATETDPKVSISSLELSDEALDQALLALRLNAEQLASVQPAGLPGVLEGQPPPAVLDVGHLVAWTLGSAAADPLTWIQRETAKYDDEIMLAEKVADRSHALRSGKEINCMERILLSFP